MFISNNPNKAVDKVGGSKGTYALIALTIEHMFSYIKYHDEEHRAFNRAFLKGKAVAMWCDCSNMFNVETLQKRYEEAVREHKVI